MNGQNHAGCERLFAKGDSCGALVLRPGGEEPEVLMLSHGSRGWVFPKNRQAEGESERDAAAREISDAAGISAAFVPGFRREAGSGLKNDGRKMIYFLALALTETLVIKDPDHSMPAWQPVSRVPELLRFAEDLPPLTEALAFLKNTTGRKVILTGERQVGKSTALNRFLAEYRGSVAGFRTLFDTREQPDNRQLLLHPLPAGKSAPLAVWRGGKPAVDLNAFNQLVPPLLRQPADLTVLDELGKFEGGAAELQAAAEALFSDPARSLAAVVRRDAPDWMGALKQREDVTVLTVTEENRDSVPGLLRLLLG